MTDDIVKRLRDDTRSAAHCSLSEEAADEIERLRGIAQAAPNPLPRKSAMETALRYMRIEATRLEENVRTVSGAGEGAEIYRDAAKCIEFALSSVSSTSRGEGE